MADRLSVDLYTEEGERSQRFVSVSVEDGTLRLETQDLGPAVEDFFGDSDYEFWITVEREHWDRLLVALLVEFMSDDSQATDRLTQICNKHKVPYKRMSWR